MTKKTVYTTHLKMMADLLTPIGVYSILRDHYPNSLLLESAHYHDRSESKSFICLDPISGFEATKNKYTVQYPNEEENIYQVENSSDVLRAFKSFMNSFEASINELPFNSSGLFGYSSFEAVEYMENIKLSNAADEIKDNPDLKYQLFRFVLIFDHFKNELYLTYNSFEIDDNSKDQLEIFKGLLRLNSRPNFKFKTIGDESSSISDEEFKSYVLKGINHCKRGDVFQIVLSRPFKQDFKGDDFNVYRCLRSINPSPYLFYFDYGNFKIFGSSPEAQLQIEDGIASINPIAGTVLRGKNQEEDNIRATELKNNPKENAEHVMLVDLARNDLSKNSDQVSVDTYAEIQYFSHVIHLVSKVSGKIDSDKNSIDIYANTFPAGTLSGAPKYRALEIINEIESVSRNFYGGALGFFGFDGSINHAIIIRSILSKNNTLCYQAGAGIVVNSSQEGELQEVNNKVAALRKAIKKAIEL